MKKILFIFFVFLLLVACASTKPAAIIANPAGDWSYVITGTPDGDFSGIMYVVREVNAYTAKLTVDDTELPIENFSFDEQTKHVTGVVYYNGTPVSLDAIFTDTEMAGAMSAGGMQFPFKALRKKES